MGKMMFWHPFCQSPLFASNLVQWVRELLIQEPLGMIPISAISEIIIQAVFVNQCDQFNPRVHQESNISKNKFVESEGNFHVFLLKKCYHL